MPVTRREWPEGRKMAAEIVKRHPEVFRNVPPLDDILFVLDEDAEPKSKGNCVMARVSKIAGKFLDFIDAGNKTWMLEWFSANVGAMSIAKRYLLMAHELLHFEFDDEKGVHRLRGHDTEEFYLIGDRFGYHWIDETHGDVEDIMAPGFTWGRQVQATVEGMLGRNVVPLHPTGTEGKGA